MEIGDKIKMCSERQRYTVQGFNDRFVIATKPFNARRTYLYTMIDREKRIRGPLNTIFGLPCDVDSPEGAADLLDWIEDDGGPDVWHVSYRRKMPLTDAEFAQVELNK